MRKLLLVFAVIAIAACSVPMDLGELECPPPEGANPDPNSLCE